MDERRLKETLEKMAVPAPDENARKRALNLALAEFDAACEKNKKTSRGFSFLSRLMSGSHQEKRRETMFKNKKTVYGGMATAMAVILICGISVQQFTTGSYKREAEQKIAQPAATGFSDQKAALDSSVAVAENQALSRGPDQSQSYEVPVASPPVAMMDQSVMASPASEGVAASAPMEMERAVAIGMPSPEYYPVPVYQDAGRDQFKDFNENSVTRVAEAPVSTFSIDVDTASYSFMRRQINSGVLPQKDAVRAEEIINYFDYAYPAPDTKEEPFKPSVTVVPSPWKDGNKLVHIGIKGYDIAPAEKPRSNLVFLLDVSGSMSESDKLPLLKNSMKLLLETLSPEDTVAIVVYAGAAGTVLEPTKAGEKAKIIQALENLSAGGSTAGAEGIQQAYRLAESAFDKEAVNRVILATDGDFNVGISDPEELKDFIAEKRKSGVFLSVLGFGQGNYNDRLMQELAQNGNGAAAYIDTLSEARKVLVEEAGSTLFPIAKDVKIQIEFNPATVAEYRLVGYETRHLEREDFNNDAVDAGDIGAGHTVTAIYEITPVGGPVAIDESRYAAPSQKSANHAADTNFKDEYAFLKIRYKLPDGNESKLMTTSITTGNERKTLEDASEDVRFSVAAAGFAQLLRDGKYTGKMTYDDVIAMAQKAKGSDEFGYRAEFINLARLGKALGDKNSGAQPE